MRVGFAGSHEISWFCLRAIAQLCRAHGDALVGVFNHPRDIGGSHSAFVTFEGLESDYRFPHHLIDSLSSPESLNRLRAMQLDVLFIIGWHRIVPQAVIDVAPYCLGIHSSLLPKNRGSSPINWSLINGDSIGGLTYFHLSEGVDTGDIIGQKSWAIGPRDTVHDLYKQASVAAVELLREHWGALRAGTLLRLPQDDGAATLNGRRRPSDGQIYWDQSARRIDALVRATTHPYPGAFTSLQGRTLHIWESEIVSAPASFSVPGTFVVHDGTIDVITGEGLLRLRRLQFAGEPECTAKLFASVYELSSGAVADGVLAGAAEPFNGARASANS